MSINLGNKNNNISVLKKINFSKKKYCIEFFVLLFKGIIIHFSLDFLKQIYFINYNDYTINEVLQS